VVPPDLSVRPPARATARLPPNVAATRSAERLLGAFAGAVHALIDVASGCAAGRYLTRPLATVHLESSHGRIWTAHVLFNWRVLCARTSWRDPGTDYRVRDPGALRALVTGYLGSDAMVA
jgi:hypothetical protein